MFSTDEFSVRAPFALTGWREMLSVGSCKELCCCIHHKVSSSFLCFTHRGAVRVHWGEIHLAVSTLLTVSSSQLKSTADRIHPLVFLGFFCFIGPCSLLVLSEVGWWVTEGARKQKGDPSWTDELGFIWMIKDPELAQCVSAQEVHCCYGGKEWDAVICCALM